MNHEANFHQADTLETDAVDVRDLRASDLDWIVRIDAEHGTRVRHEYYRVKLAEMRHDTGVRISLAAEIAGEPAGFLLARVYYGEFGAPEPAAILDSLGVAGAFVGKHVARALLRQLELHLAALGVERLETQIGWTQLELLGFFQHAGFRPAARLCLEKRIVRPLR